MGVSDDLSRLSVRVKESGDHAAAATAQAREKLEQAIDEGRAGTQQATEMIHSESAAAAEAVSRTPAT